MIEETKTNTSVSKSKLKNRILVIDDELGIALIFTMVLQSKGLTA
jgi:hypothetical protein